MSTFFVCGADMVPRGPLTWGQVVEDVNRGRLKGSDHARGVEESDWRTVASVLSNAPVAAPASSVAVSWSADGILTAIRSVFWLTLIGGGLVVLGLLFSGSLLAAVAALVAGLIQLVILAGIERALIGVRLALSRRGS